MRCMSAAARRIGATSRSAARAAWWCTRASRCSSRCRPAGRANSTNGRRRGSGRRSAANGAAWEPANLHRLAIRVEPGHIRVDADEVTYPAHVILRYRLETALLSGDLALADLPGAWNEGIRGLARHHAAGRPPRLPPGHPLVFRGVGLFPDLYAGRARRGADLRRGGQGRAGGPAGPRAGRFRAADGVAPPQRPWRRARASRPTRCSRRRPAGRWTRRRSSAICAGATSTAEAAAPALGRPASTAGFAL